MLIFLYLSLFLLGSTDHDVHLSKSEINYDTKTQTVQVSISLFLDDLENALAARGAEGVKLFSSYEVENAEELIAEYLDEKIRFVQGNKDLFTTYLGREISEDLSAVWCYIEVAQVAQDQMLTVTNEIFMEIYDDQKHVMVITKDLKRVDHWIIDEAPYAQDIRL